MSALLLPALLLPAALLSCGNQNEGWIRVAKIHDEYEGTDFYSIVHADPATGSCVTVFLTPPPSYGDEDEGVDVRINGAELVVHSAWGDAEGAETCTTGWSVGGVVAASGTIDLEQCSISYELSIESWDEQLYEISAHKFPIRAADCPRPVEYVGEYTQLDAAFGEYGELGNLVISAWDAEREVCVWARLLSTNEGGLPESEVDAPGSWFYSGLRFGRTERDACVASNFIQPPVSPDYAVDTASALSSSGSVSFVERATIDFLGAELEVPCRVDVELSLQSIGRYFWTPDDVHVRGFGVPVAGACE